MREELLKGLSPEQLEKARACRSSEELLQLAKEEGLELNDAQLEAVAGGTCDATPPQNNVGSLPTPTGPRCPRCGSTNTIAVYDSYYSEGMAHRCNNCGNIWE